MKARWIAIALLLIITAALYVLFHRDPVPRQTRMDDSSKTPAKVTAKTLPSSAKPSPQRQVDSLPETESEARVQSWLEARAESSFQLQKVPGTDQIMSVLGGRFPGVGANAETAFQFLDEFSAQVGAPPGSLDRETLFETQTARKKVYGYDQQFKGYKVFNSYARVQVNAKDNSVFMIMNELKAIDESLKLPTLVLDLDSAKKKALDHFAGRYSSAEAEEHQLLVYPVDPQTIDLVWNLYVEGIASSQFVLVSAVDGDVVAHFPAQTH